MFSVVRRAIFTGELRGPIQRRGLHLASNTGDKKVRVLPTFSLQDKTCVVTGAARGLGYEFCRAFIKSGCTRIGIIDLHQKDADAAAASLVEEFESTGEIEPGSLTTAGFQCDVANEQSVKDAFGAITNKWSKIDCTVASAGIVNNYTAFEYPTDSMKLLYDINVHGSFFTAREAAKTMAEHGGGSIILIASMSAHIINFPQPQTPYNASKAAVKHMASSLAFEWAKAGVRVNSLSPGYIMTKLTKAVLENKKEWKQTWETLTPMGKMGDPEDLHGAIVFLASDASSFMTGADLRVDGGYCVL